MTLDDAIVFATAAHAGERDKQGEPYILHPLRVMLRMRSESERIVAVLHDVVEHHPQFEGNLELRLTGAEFTALMALTRKIGEDYFDYIRRVSNNDFARKVKLADLADNMDRTRGEIPVTLKLRYERAARDLEGG